MLRLARGMTYKSAAAGLDLGGGKAVIIGDPATDKTEALLRAYGRFIDTLGGRYITAEDVGTTQADMDVIFTGDPQRDRGLERPWAAPVTRRPRPPTGVWWAMKAARTELDATDDLAGRHVVVTGVGKVGPPWSATWSRTGAGSPWPTSSDAAVARVSPGTELGRGRGRGGRGRTAVACDIFSPCALGGALNETTIPELGAGPWWARPTTSWRHPADGRRLAERGIVYAPDFVVNAGGVINIAEELAGYNRERAYANVQGIFDTTRRVLARQPGAGSTTNEVAEAMARTAHGGRRRRRLTESAASTAPRPAAGH